MSIIEEVTYGDGGYDDSQPEKNITARRTATIPIDDVNRYQLLAKAKAALAGNKAFLDLPDYPANPTTAQRDQAIRAVISQALALTRQNDAVIRLLTEAFDDVSDT